MNSNKEKQKQGQKLAFEEEYDFEQQHSRSNHLLVPHQRRQ